jgi:Protein of unknown function (DUF2612)
MDVDSLIAYYANLLIIQYHDQPKAQAEIQLLAKTMLASGIFSDIQAAYDIDTAVGVQLDVIGKYVGVDRFYSELVLQNYFSFIAYSEVVAPPASPPRFGYSTYANFTAYSYNGTLTYSGLIATGNQLTDDAYRTLIKLKIIINSSNFSHEQIDDDLFEFFGTQIRAESIGNMEMVFFISGSLSSLIQAIIFKKLLPRPMGVGAAVVENISGLMFSFDDYAGHASIYGHGFCDYSTFASLSGQVLQYSQIIGD